MTKTKELTYYNDLLYLGGHEWISTECQRNDPRRSYTTMCIRTVRHSRIMDINSKSTLTPVFSTNDKLLHFVSSSPLTISFINRGMYATYRTERVITSRHLPLFCHSSQGQANNQQPSCMECKIIPSSSSTS